jgi:cytochrome oxidase Cu insertion factor (SCO1/SenC/PrrC family)
VGLLLLLFSLAVAFVLAGLHSRVARTQPLPIYGPVDDFTLTNQSGGAVAGVDLRGHVWVADIIFTRCAGPCLRMSQQMKELQESIPAGSRTRLVSLTTDPEFDTPPVLLKYAGRFGADTNRWMFLTGTKKQIGDVATKSLKLSAVETQPAERASADELFVHSTVFVVVDKLGRLRGIFQTGGDGVSWVAEKQKVLAAVRQLERER